MTESNEDKINRLRLMIAQKQQTWDLSVNDVNAIKLALAEIERLTQENADLKSKLERESTEELTSKIAELATLCVNTQYEMTRLKLQVNTLMNARRNGGAILGQDDLEKEVME